MDQASVDCHAAMLTCVSGLGCSPSVVASICMRSIAWRTATTLPAASSMPTLRACVHWCCAVATGAAASLLLLLTVSMLLLYTCCIVSCRAITGCCCAEQLMDTTVQLVSGAHLVCRWQPAPVPAQHCACHHLSRRLCQGHQQQKQKLGRLAEAVARSSDTPTGCT
jgi:hypothetical protein